MKAFAIAFLILAMATCVGVTLGYTHHTATVVICLLVAGVSFTQIKEDEKADKNLY